MEATFQFSPMTMLEESWTLGTPETVTGCRMGGTRAPTGACLLARVPCAPFHDTHLAVMMESTWMIYSMKSTGNTIEQLFSVLEGQPVASY